MAKTNFTLPKSSMCVVVWYRNGKKNETLLPTPVTNDDLRNKMLTEHKVGFSELRAVKAVTATEMFRGR
jgi:hypothetical protein